MSKTYRRPLNTTKLALDFVINVLGEENDQRRNDLTDFIMNNELSLRELETKSSLNNQDYRNAAYLSDVERMALRERIVGELIYLERIDNDDEIQLGVGGAKPKETRNQRVAVIVTGSPASGKSSVASKLAEQMGAFLLDSDYAKRKLPEFSNRSGGASYVHEESDRLIFGDEFSLFEYCVSEGTNIVIPAVGKTLDSLNRVINRIQQLDYTIHIVNVALDRYECVWRAIRRAEKTGRYVPLAYIFDEVANEPERIYYILKRDYRGKKRKGSRIIASFGQLSNDVPLGQDPYIIEADRESPVWSCYQIATKGRAL